MVLHLRCVKECDATMKLVHTSPSVSSVYIILTVKTHAWSTVLFIFSPIVAYQKCIKQIIHWIHLISISSGTKVATSQDLKLATTAVLVRCRSDTASSKRRTVIFLPDTLRHHAVAARRTWSHHLYSHKGYGFLKHCVWHMGMQTYTPTQKLGSLADR